MSLGLSARFQIVDINGLPIVGAKWHVYEPDTVNTDKDIWLNKDFTGAAANPVISDSNGFFDAWYVDGEYQSEITDSDDIEIITDDNIVAATVASATTVIEGLVKFGLASDVAAQTAGLTLDLKDIPSMAIDASQLTGTLLVSVIPNLPASKITSGEFDQDRLPQATETVKGAGEIATSAEITAGTAGKLVDAAGLAAAASVTTVGTGFKKTVAAGGTFMVCSGTVSVGSDSTTTTVTIPDGGYGNTNYAINLTYQSSGTGEQDNWAYNTKTATNFKITNGQNQALTFDWQTMGNVS